MVMEKKWSRSILTFTKMAVRMKRSNMKTKLPAIRIFSAMLHKANENKITHDYNTTYTPLYQYNTTTCKSKQNELCLTEPRTHCWYRKELRSVNSSKGSWASSTLMLSNIYGSDCEESVPFLKRSVKYCKQKRMEDEHMTFKDNFK